MYAAISRMLGQCLGFARPSGSHPQDRQRADAERMDMFVASNISDSTHVPGLASRQQASRAQTMLDGPSGSSGNSGTGRVGEISQIEAFALLYTFLTAVQGEMDLFPPAPRADDGAASNTEAQRPLPRPERRGIEAFADRLGLTIPSAAVARLRNLSRPPVDDDGHHHDRIAYLNKTRDEVNALTFEAIDGVGFKLPKDWRYLEYEIKKPLLARNGTIHCADVLKIWADENALAGVFRDPLSHSALHMDDFTPIPPELADKLKHLCCTASTNDVSAT